MDAVATAPSPLPSLARRHFLGTLLAAGAAVAIPVPASAATVSYYGRGYRTGGYR
ncbi:hypothetical protein [uncultured Friedmanniella sp.]|uniref:hypothetical protein n=1 Tax=uncultured Friedmanniella sp. TaxID=335381 RepID=UPI0035C9B258